MWSHLYRFIFGDGELHAELKLSGERLPDLLDGSIRQRAKPSRHLNHIGHKLVQITIPERSKQGPNRHRTTVRQNSRQVLRVILDCKNSFTRRTYICGTILITDHSDLSPPLCGVVQDLHSTCMRNTGNMLQIGHATTPTRHHEVGRTLSRNLYP